MPVVTRSQTRQRKQFNLEMYNNFLGGIPEAREVVEAYVGATRNGFTNEQLLAPTVLKKRIALEALDDWYDREDEDLLDVYSEVIAFDPLMLLYAFRIFCCDRYHL